MGPSFSRSKDCVKCGNSRAVCLVEPGGPSIRAEQKGGALAKCSEKKLKVQDGGIFNKRPVSFWKGGSILFPCLMMYLLVFGDHFPYFKYPDEVAAGLYFHGCDIIG